MKPSMTAIELLHMTRILTGSGEVKSLQVAGRIQKMNSTLAIRVAVAAFGTDKNHFSSTCGREFFYVY